MLTKHVSDSEVIHHMTIVPADLNHRNTIFGGKVLAVADQIAGTVARLHCGIECVTVAVDSVRFLAQAKQGETLIVRASANNVWGSSMEIGVKVFSMITYPKREKHILSAYFTFVAVNQEDKPVEIPCKLSPMTPNEIRRFHQATERRKYRLSKKRR